MTAASEPTDIVAADGERLFIAAAALTAERMQGIAPPRGYIGELSHLQPTYKAATVELAQAASPRPRVSPSLTVDFSEHFNRVGTFDISLAWDGGTAYGELKAGAGTGDIGHCAWDALKCAVAVAKRKAASTYLVAAAPAKLWTATTLGCELFEDRTWDTLELRERYASWFEWYERKDAQRPLRVVAALRTVALARFYFTVVADRWILGVARVQPDGGEWLEWEPFHPEEWEDAAPAAASEPVIEALPFNYAWTKRFSDATPVAGYEGGAVYAAEGEGAFWLIQDEGTMADFLDPDEDADLLGALVKLKRFDDRAAWEAECAAVRARHDPVRSEADGDLSDADDVGHT